jgi:hypothetical protein
MLKGVSGWGQYVLVKVALDDAPAVFLADDAFVFLGGEVLSTPVCHHEDSHTLKQPAELV